MKILVNWIYKMRNFKLGFLMNDVYIMDEKNG